MVKNMTAMQETQVQSLGWKDSLEEGMATHVNNYLTKIQNVSKLKTYICVCVYVCVCVCIHMHNLWQSTGIDIFPVQVKYRDLNST
jgi:hypothetical protein